MVSIYQLPYSGFAYYLITKPIRVDNILYPFCIPKLRYHEYKQLDLDLDLDYK